MYDLDYLPFDNTTLENHRRIVQQHGGIQNLIHIWEINEFNESKRWLDEYEKLSLQLEKSEAKRQAKIKRE